MSRLALRIAVILSAVVIAGCSGGNEYPVQEASEAQTNHIRGALSGEAAVVGSFHAVESQRHNRAWYIGACMEVQGERYAPVWFVSGAPSQPRLLYSVDDEAYKLSQMGRADGTKARTRPTDAEAKTVERSIREAGCFGQS